MKKMIPLILAILLVFTGCQSNVADNVSLFPLNQVDANPYMSSGEAVVHADPYNSDVSNVPGIMGINVKTGFAYDPDSNSSLIFTDQWGHKIVPYQNGIAIRDFSGESITTLGLFKPVNDDGSSYTLQTSYMYIDNLGNAIAPTNDGRITAIRMTDEQGGVLPEFELIADIPVVEMAANAFPNTETDRNLLSLIADYDGNLWFASGGVCVYPDNYPQGFAGYIEASAFQKLLKGEDVNLAEAAHFMCFTGREGLRGEAAENGISACKDGVVVLTNMACYLFRARQDGVEQVWKQPYESNGTNSASKGSPYPGGGLAWGSGTTPTLSKRLVFFTDNADPISLIALDIASGKQVIKIPLFAGIGEDTPMSVDNSIIVYGRDEDTCLVVAGNTFGLWAQGVRTDPKLGDIQLGGTLIETAFIKNGNIALSPGMDCVEVKQKNNGEYEARILWHRDDMRNSSVSRLSAPSGRLFLYNQNLDTRFWQFEVLDVQTGQTLYTVPISDSPVGNNCGAIVQIDPCGYKISIPTADRRLWSAWDDFVTLEEGENARISDIIRFVPDDEASSAGYGYGCSVAGEDAVLLIEITDMTADAEILKLCAKTADGSVTLDKSLYSILDKSSETVVDSKLNAMQTYTLRLNIQDGQPFDLDVNSGRMRVEVYFTTK